MTDLEILKKAFTDVGLIYMILKSKRQLGYFYLFFVYRNYILNL